MKLKTLTEASGHAIDVLLMNGQNQRGAVPQVASGEAAEQLSAASKVLKLLDSAADEQPPADLAQRTLERIQEAAYGKPAPITPMTVDSASR